MARPKQQPTFNPVLDFVGGKHAHRRLFGGGRGQPLARAIGVRGSPLPKVVDATAGTGQDALVLATLGCEVVLVERSEAVCALLVDALTRAAAEAETAEIVARMTLVHADAAVWLAALAPQDAPDVVYMDPMYPHSGKNAASRAEMQWLQSVVGPDIDSHLLLDAAIAATSGRVVVKRPRRAPFVADWRPSGSVEGPNTRYDIYAGRLGTPS